MSNFRDYNYRTSVSFLGEEFSLTDEPIILHDVIIGRFGLVMTSKFEKIEGPANLVFDMWMPLRTPSWSPFKHVPADLLRSRNNQLICLPNGVYVSIVEFLEGTTYGHFWDHAQSLLFLNPGNHDIILHSPSRVANLNDHLRLFGFNKSLMIDVTRFNYKVPTLIIPPVIQCPALLHGAVIQELRERYWRLAPDDISPQKIYIMRPKKQWYNINNQQQVCDILTAHGFTIFTGSESLCDVVRMFRSASLIVGYHGSGMKNMIFCRPGQTKLIYLYCEGSRCDQSFTHLTEICDVECIKKIIHSGGPQDTTILSQDIINDILCLST